MIFQSPQGARPFSDQAIRDTVEKVFSSGEFGRASLLSRLFAWGLDQLRRLWQAMPSVGSPGLSWVLRIGIVLLVIGVIGRIAYAWIVERRFAVDGDNRPDGRGRLAPVRDPLALANEAAGRGDFTAAAHALYAALLHAIARKERVRLHPSKTVGDYVRDLRGKSSSLFGRFRDFSRSYEVVIYGVGVCDRDRYERLHLLAADMLSPPGGRVA